MASSILFCILISVGGISASLSGVSKSDVLGTMLSSYDKRMRPHETEDAVDTVKHQLYVNRIVDFDVHKHVLTLDVWAMLHWHDDRVAWLRHISGLEQYTKLFVEPDRLWMPDFVIYNSAAHPNAKLETSLHLAHTGDIYYVPAYVIQTYCDVNESIHVGDHVECKIVFGSWLYDANEVDIQMWDAENPTMDLKNFEDSNLDWGIESTLIAREIMKYPCCPGEYAKLVYTLNLVKKNRPCH